MVTQNHNRHRTGGVYIAVLGTSLVVAMLGLAAVMGQRIQNRMLVAAGQIRQAQLNANSAVELALLKMKQDTNWRTNYSNGNWFTIDGGVAGTCVASVTDPVDGNLANSTDGPVVVLGIGTNGQAEQRVEVTVDPRKSSLSCLDSAIAVGNEIDLSGDTLRTDGTINATTIDASSSQVYGTVKAVTISGSTYQGTTTTISSQEKPTMPTWSSVFNYYRTNGTQIPISNLPTSTPNLARNTSFDTNTQYWTGEATGLPVATIVRATNVNGHVACLRVQGRAANGAGASQYIDHFVKPGGSYNISVEAAATSLLGNAFRVKLATKGTGAVQTSESGAFLAVGTGWQTLNVTLTAPSWSGPLEYARVTIDTDPLLGRIDPFHIDNIDIRENTNGRFIYRQVLGPGVNPFGSTNSQGIYWINCNGNRLVIERSRIKGTLLVINPGSNSCIGEGPISWSPAVAGYPALMVDADTAVEADFLILASNRGLSETENGVNYNPSGAAHDDLGTDTDSIDIFRSSIRGLVVIEDDLSYANSPLIQGQLVVGGDIRGSSGALEVEFLPDSQLNPPPNFFAPETYVRRPTSTRKVVLP
jgi:hypothetical protein